MRVVSSLLLLLLLLPGRGAGQTLQTGDPREEFLRVLETGGVAEAGSFILRPITLQGVTGDPTFDLWGELSSLTSQQEPASGIRRGEWGAAVRSYYNSGFPVGQNDGAVLQGRGATLALDLGGTVAYGPVTITLRPTLVYQQNSDFPLARPDRPGEEVYRYPWSDGVDIPQRLGPDAVSYLDPGQSSIRIGGERISAGVGTENLWWGPGSRYALLMSNNAAGFLHLDLRTERPLEVGPLRLEGQWLWGRLAHSDWHRDADAPDRFITGALLAITPRGVPGLTLGMSRVFYFHIPEDGLPLKEAFLVFQGVRKETFATPENPLGDDVRDQMAAFFARWVLPASGVELYLEWGRNDHGSNIRDYFVQPEHASAYVIGIRKTVLWSEDRILAITAESTHLEQSGTRTNRMSPPWYHHQLVSQGYTQRGEVIGAGVGPGGNALFVGADLYHRGGRLGGFVQRRAHNNDAYYDQAAFGSSVRNHVSLDLGANALHRSGSGLDFEARLVLTKDFNRYFQRENDKWNLHLEAGVRWRGR